jgi:hypothetical protein
MLLVFQCSYAFFAPYQESIKKCRVAWGSLA